MRKLAVISCLVLVGLTANAGAALATTKPATTFVVVMTAAQEVPLCPTADKTDVGVAFFHVVDEKAGKVSYTILSSDLPGNLIAAHIHRAQPGVPGPVVQPLNLEPGVERGLIAHDTFVNAPLLLALREHPRRFYVNVHTDGEKGCPSGVIRGQFG